MGGSRTAAAESLISDDGQREIERMLCNDPSSGDVIVGTGGVRKLRVGLPGTGKRGGARLIHYYRQSKGRIYLILIYPKSRKDNLTLAERNEMRRLTGMLEGEN